MSYLLSNAKLSDIIKIENKKHGVINASDIFKFVRPAKLMIACERAFSVKTYYQLDGNFVKQLCHQDNFEL